MRTRDSWNKQKGIDKDRAKGMYVAALLKVSPHFMNGSPVRLELMERAKDTSTLL